MQYHQIALSDELHLPHHGRELYKSHLWKLDIKGIQIKLPNSYTTLRPKKPVEAPKMVTFRGFCDIRPPIPLVPGIISFVIVRYELLFVPSFLQQKSELFLHYQVDSAFSFIIDSLQKLSNYSIPHHILQSMIKLWTDSELNSTIFRKKSIPRGNSEVFVCHLDEREELSSIFCSRFVSFGNIERNEDTMMQM